MLLHHYPKVRFGRNGTAQLASGSPKVGEENAFEVPRPSISSMEVGRHENSLALASAGRAYCTEIRGHRSRTSAVRCYSHSSLLVASSAISSHEDTKIDSKTHKFEEGEGRGDGQRDREGYGIKRKKASVGGTTRETERVTGVRTTRKTLRQTDADRVCDRFRFRQADRGVPYEDIAAE